MDDDLSDSLRSITFILSIIAGYTIVDPLTDEFTFYLFGGFSVGFLLYAGVYFYQKESQRLPNSGVVVTAANLL